MTDFFARQEKARRRTGVFLVYFAAAVALTTLLVYLVVALIFAYADKRGGQTLWHPEIFLWSSVGTLGLIFGASAFRMMELASGGGAVARALGGSPVNPQTRDPLERRLVNVVEEMSLASGVPVPEIYVLREEEGINAFAAGTSPSNAAIGVTQGCLKWLTRDELQGVIAHEFSHILNGDMKLNLRLIGFIAGILCLTTIGMILMRSRGRGKGAGQVVLFGLALLLVGWIGSFFARLIQAAISRQREFLADASAVQFTRLPDGLAGALKKIGGLAQGSKLEAPRACEAGHLFFSDGLSSSFSELMSTHPPLVERIRALDPSFNGEFPQPRMPATTDRPAVSAPRRTPPPPIPGRLPGLPPIIPVPAGQALALAGTVAPAHLQFAADLRESLPPDLAAAAQEPFGATVLVYSLLLSQSPAVRAKQLNELATVASARVAAEVQRLAPRVAQLPVNARLPLVDLLLPALRGLSPAQHDQFTRALESLITADQQIDLFEFALQKVLRRHLEPQFRGPEKQVVQYYSTKAIAAEISLLLSALAHVGQKDPRTAQAAFATGIRHLAASPAYAFVPWESCNPEALDAALDKCAASVPAIRAQVLNAMVQTVAADGVIQPAEAELIRAFADALGCPLPPYVQPAP